MRKILVAATIATAALTALMPASSASAHGGHIAHIAHEGAVIGGEARGVVSTIVDLAFKRRTFHGYGETADIALNRARDEFWNYSKHCEEVSTTVTANDGFEVEGAYRATVYARCHRLM